MASTLSLFVLGVITVYFCYLQWEIAKYSQDRYDKMYVLVWLIFFIICNFSFYFNLDLVPPVDLFLLVGYFSMIAFFWCFHIIWKRILKKEVDKSIRTLDENFQKNKAYLQEIMRKGFHLFVFFGCLTFIILYNIIGMDVFDRYPDFAAYCYNPIWEDSILAPLNEDFVLKPLFFIPSQTQVAMMIFFMIAIPFAIITEYFRLNPRLNVPFQPLFLKSLRPHEQHNAGDYFYFAFGFFVATFFLPAEAAFGVLCVMCFGDTAASLLGKRLNEKYKHHIKWEPKKCWEGSIVGFIFTFVSAIWFVGWLLALILSFIFIIFDMITPTKIKISDNFVYPFITVAVLFVILTLGFQIDAPVANYFREVNEWFLAHKPIIRC